MTSQQKTPQSILPLVTDHNIASGVIITPVLITCCVLNAWLTLAVLLEHMANLMLNYSNSYNNIWPSANYTGRFWLLCGLSLWWASWIKMAAWEGKLPLSWQDMWSHVYKYCKNLETEMYKCCIILMAGYWAGGNSEELAAVHAHFSFVMCGQMANRARILSCMQTVCGVGLFMVWKGSASGWSELFCLQFVSLLAVYSFYHHV